MMPDMSALLTGLVLSIPVAGMALLAARILHGSAGAHPDRVWGVALLVALAPVPLALFAPLLADASPVAFTLPELGETAGIGGGEGLPPVAGEPALRIGMVPLLLALWLTGVALRAGRELTASARLARLVHRLSPAGTQLTALVGERAAIAGLTGRIEVRVSPDHGAPFLTGLARPLLVVPAGFGERAGDAAIIDHELVHARRVDPRLNAVVRALGVLVWFNPFWFALERGRRLAVEMACDGAVVRRLEPGRARLYARALLDAVKADSGPSITVGFGVDYKKALKMRLSHILNPSPKTDALRLLGGAACALALLAGLGSAQAALAAGVRNDAPVFTHSVLEGRVSSTYGPRSLDLPVPPFHGGLDIAAPLGSSIRAPAGGQVAFAGDNYRQLANWGHVVVIDHGGGWATLYAHLGDIHVSVGDRVSAGEIIAEVGMTGLSTGPHLHVEVLENGERRDPAAFLPGLASYVRVQD